MRLAQIILDIPTQSLDTAYTYAVPDDLVDAEVGCAVLVPFGNRQAIGYAVALEEVDAEDASALVVRGVDPVKLKAVQRVLSHSYFDELGAACAHYLSEEYIAPLCSCVRLFTPPGGVPRMVHTGKYWRLEEPQIGPVDDRWVRLGPAAAGFEPKKTAVKQKAIVDALASGELRVAELSMELGSVSSVLKTLAEKEVVVLETRRRLRGTGAGEAGSHGARAESFVPSAKPDLTCGQAKALEAIDAAQQRSAGDVVLVDGVTGSGKTEVYLRAIETTLASGLGAIVLVPEISLTPQTVARFRGRFGDTVAVMHSRMSQGERYDQWDLIRSGAARVVVGARSALFTPMPDLGLIIIDEEHEGSYKQDSAPRYVARDVAAWMVAERGATLVLGSATPSIETLYRCDKYDNWHRVVLAERANGKPMPEVTVIDMAREFGSGHRSMFSRKLTKALIETIEAGQKAVLLLNQRGFASFLLCRECGFVPECPSCSTSLTYHEKGSVLVCHHCGHKEPVPPVCPECGSPYLKKFGAGTQRVEAELVSVLEGTGARVVRMDADTTSAKGAHQKLLEEFASAGAAVLLGTQMIAKGLDFDDVTLVGVINADTMLKLPDFRSAERTFSLIEQVAGRAGRADLPGRVMVQTYWADSCAIQAAATYDRALFLKDELPKRRLLGYPPYVRMANVLVWGKDESEVECAARELSADIERTVLEQAGEQWSVLPANPCVLSRLRGTYRWHIVVKAPMGSDVSSVLLPLFRKRKASKTVNVAVDVDPHDML
ncbi:replication restart helicase PriA [Raoultibacter phocaeensis]|uniref:replication restart helicase PriA n=1 Tax=Raoultibacter phocaeensis TaxID=2479841 RepID=UPI00111954BC|nr:primosomal protein N' [Raoultibacter phocaeensis]